MKTRKLVSLVVLGILLLNLSLVAVADENLDKIKFEIERAACYILNIVTVIVGVVAALFIFLSGVKWVTAEDPVGRKEARDRIMWSLIGFCVVILACPFAEFLAKDSPLETGFCMRCGVKYGTWVPTGPAPPWQAPTDGVYEGQDDAPIVTLRVDKTTIKPGESITFTCEAHDDPARTIPSGRIDYGPEDKILVSGSPTNEFSDISTYTYSASGMYAATCAISNDIPKMGTATQVILVSDSTNPAAVIDSVGGKTFAEILEDDKVERDLQGKLGVRGHIGGGGSGLECVWEIAGTQGTGCDINIPSTGMVNLGPNTLIFRAMDGMAPKAETSVGIEVVEYSGDIDCERDENCEAEDTDGGNKPEKNGVCNRMECTDRGECKKLQDYPDECEGNHIDLTEYFPDPRGGIYANTCEYEYINCYDECGVRGGECANGKCECFEDNCIMKPRSVFTGVVELDDDNCRLKGTTGVGAKGYITISAGTDYFYYKTAGTPCTFTSLDVVLGGCYPGGCYNTVSGTYDCSGAGAYTGKCKITLSYYQDSENNEYFSVCLEDAS
jgi:hypothetical protein